MYKNVVSVKISCESCQCVRVSHVVSRTNKRLRTEHCDIRAAESTCRDIEERISSFIANLTRPKRLLVFVNPLSGHKKSVKIYRAKVLPLFNLAGIHTQTIETSRCGEPIDLLSTFDLRLIHGIVSIGGDGMFSDCVNGLLSRLQTDSGVDKNDPDADITTSNIPVGIIPTGSGNYLVNYIHGTKDVETATLKIILGDHHMSNVVSLHQEQKLSRYASLLMGFGLVGRMMHDCEKFRWLGPSRYNVVPVATLTQRKLVDVHVEYVPAEEKKSNHSLIPLKYSRQVSLPASHPTKNRKLLPRLNSVPVEPPAFNKADWRKLDCSVYGVDTYVVTQREKGGSLVPRFADGALTLWLTERCSLPEHVEQLSRLQHAKAGYLDFDFIRQVRTTRYRVKLKDASSKNSEGGRHQKKKYYINVDGEAIELLTHEFEVKLHHCAMPIYGKIDS
ncbi:ceramide kinase-like isoform X2 [Dreissena polymorpha]|nr:ceramide kinase-like isoform X2 [Dreissena polymorpha]KAH3695587.1 hypothetical protein DPMN_083045 [Dreissena polymorpha]